MASALESSRVVAVVGSGAMGAGIAQIAAAAGHAVKLFDTREEAIAKAIDSIRTSFDKLVQKGKMTAADAKAAGARLSPAKSLQDLADAGLIVEAIVENLDVKRQLFTDLSKLVGADCILASNTSSLSITAIAAGLPNAQRILGMHFFNPAPAMPLVEVVSGLATDKRFADTIYATALAWGKTPVHTKSMPGFIVNRVARPFYAEGLRLLNEQAADPATLDAIMREGGGFRMGPFELMDLIGHDVNFAVTQSVFRAFFNDPRFTPSLIQQELVDAGFLGRKSGRGFYEYKNGNAVGAEPKTERPEPAPSNVVVRQDDAPMQAILSRVPDQANIKYFVGDDRVGPSMMIGDTHVYLTDGRTATQRAADSGNPNCVLFDLVLDYKTAKRIALSPAAQCEVKAYRAVVGFFQSAGFAVSRVGDVPGMAVMRTVTMLANEAADAVNQGVCSADAVDLAMQKGVNYPRGPLQWAQEIGLHSVSTVLCNLARNYGEDRYRVSPLIRRLVWAGGKFHE